MGCFNVSCAISHITIHEGDRAFLFPLLPNISIYEIQQGHPNDGTVIVNPNSQYLYSDEYYTPFCFPIEGDYNDYGSLENIIENENTKAIEQFLKISISDLVRLITDNRGKDPYDSYGVFYKIFFDKKEYMGSDIEFGEFLIELGFKQDGMQYAFPGAKYRIEKIQKNNAESYVLQFNDESISEKLKDFDLNDPYDGKRNLLRAHLQVEKEYLGIKNKSAFEITSKLSGMFVHGDIYDFMTKRDEQSETERMNMRVPKCILKAFGFEQVEDVFLTKEGVSIKHDGYYTILKTKTQEMKVYSCKELIDSYKILTCKELVVPKEFDFDESTCLFEDMVESFQNTKGLLVNMLLHAEQSGQQDISAFLMDDLESGEWINRVNGLRAFKEMNYFLRIYEKMIENRKIKEFYIKYIRFIGNMYPVNAMFFPTFQGVQGGDILKERELVTTTLKILDKKIYKWDNM